MSWTAAFTPPGGVIFWTWKGAPTIVPDRVPRVQRRVRVLEDHLHLLAQGHELLLAEVGDVAAIEDDLARGRLQQLGHGAPGRGLAAARLAHKADRLAGPDLQVQPVDSLHGADLLAEHDALGDREVLLQARDLEQGIPGTVDGAHEILRSPNFSIMICSRWSVVMWQRARWPGSDSVSSGPGGRAQVVGDLVVVGAARPEHAALGQFEQRRRVAWDGLEPLEVDVGARHGGQQPPRVRHLRAVEQLAVPGLLDAAPAVHHQDLIGHVGDDAEVVGDQHDRRAEVVLQVAQEVDDLGLDRHVEGGRGLVGDDHLRVVDQGHGDHHALAHATGELVRVGLQALLRVGDADPVEHLLGPGQGGLLVQRLVDLDGLDQLLADLVERVQRAQRILEDHRHLLAAQLADAIVGRGDQLLAVEPDLAGDVRGLAVEQAHDGHARHALAGTRLAHDRQGLAPEDVVGELVDGLELAVLGRELDLEVADLQERLRRGAHAILTLGSIAA